jgi:hypothetical protein
MVIPSGMEGTCTDQCWMSLNGVGDRIEFTLAFNGNVRMGIQDEYPRDNLGTITVRVDDADYILDPQVHNAVSPRSLNGAGDSVVLQFVEAGSIAIGIEDGFAPDNRGTISISIEREDAPPPAAAIVGVVATATSRVGGATLDLRDRHGGLLTSRTTDIADGSYGFYDLAAGTYLVRLAVPFGFDLAEGQGAARSVTVAPGEMVTVDFLLEETVPPAEAQGAGYWYHQYHAYDTGHGRAHESLGDLLAYHQRIHDQFYLGPDEDAIRIEGVTCSNGSEVLTFEDAHETLLSNVSRPMIERACRQFLALLLNVTSEKLSTAHVATEDGETVGRVIEYVADLLEDGDSANDEDAKDLAERVNESQRIPADRIPPATPDVADPHPTPLPSVALSVAHPNPTASATWITYEVPSTGAHVSLKVFDQLGRLVCTLCNGASDGGQQDVTWDGTDRYGRRAACGVYFYRIQVGDRAETRKIVLR